MARLLEPSAFGLVAMANVLLRFGSYLAQMGIGPALIQKGDVSGYDARAAWTLAVALGFLFSLSFYFLAPLSIDIFKNGEVAAIVRVLALSFFLSSLSVTSISILRSQLQFRTIALIEMAAFVAGYVGVGITLAFLGYGVWSLVVCSLTQTTILAALSYGASRHSVIPFLNWRHSRELLSYGGRLSLVTFVQMIYSSIGPTAIGRYLGSSSLGYFNNAYRLSNLTLENLTTAITRVLFPSFSKVQSDRERLKRAFLSSYLLLAILITPIAYGMIPAGREVVLTILGPKWISSIIPFQILCVVAPLSLLNMIIGNVFDATAYLGAKLVIELVAIVSLISLIAATLSLGMVAVVMMYAVMELVRFAAYLAALRRIIKIRLSDIRLIHWIVVRNSSVVVGSIGLGHLLLVGLEVAATPALIVEIVIGAAAYLVITFVKTHDLVKNELRAIYKKVWVQAQERSALHRAVDWYANRFLSLENE